MPYTDLTDAQIVQFAQQAPRRRTTVANWAYTERVRKFCAGQDEIRIPESHKKLFDGENHEGGLELDDRIEQFAAWLWNAQPRFNIEPSGPDDVIQRGASIQERFLRWGEKRMARGRGQNKWGLQVCRDIAESGIGIIQQNPRAEFYIGPREDPIERDRMSRGVPIEEVFWRRRVDPATFAPIEDADGSWGVVVIKGRRSLSELGAMTNGDDVLSRVKGWFRLGEPKTPGDAEEVSVDTEEVWWGNGGALVVTGHNNGGVPTSISASDRIIDRWENFAGHPPFYGIMRTYPFKSPLDRMLNLTGARNYWATMHDIQASGAIFRHWQLIDQETGELSSLMNSIPENVIYDVSKPPPNMGPGTRWELAPFEFHDVTSRLAMILSEHQAAGQSVARLVGQTVGQDTAAATADSMAEAAALEFGPWLSAFADALSAMWEDAFRYLRDKHKDPVYVAEQKRAIGADGDLAFLSASTLLTSNDIVSLSVEVEMDARNRLARIADFRLAVEAMSGGFMDFDRAVDLGLIPGVDDADAEKLAIFVSELERIQTQIQLQQEAQNAQQALGGTPNPAMAPQPRFLEGTRTDPRGTGTGRGPDNASDTGVAPSAGGGSSAARRMA